MTNGRKFHFLRARKCSQNWQKCQFNSKDETVLNLTPSFKLRQSANCDFVGLVAAMVIFLAISSLDVKSQEILPPDTLCGLDYYHMIPESIDEESPQPNFYFGWTVQIVEGKHLMVGVPGDPTDYDDTLDGSNINSFGWVYFYDFVDGDWILNSKFKREPSPDEWWLGDQRFGQRILLYEDWAFTIKDGNSVADLHAAAQIYSFKYDADLGTWIEYPPIQIEFDPIVDEDGPEFAWSIEDIACQDNRLVIVTESNDLDYPLGGSMHIFDFDTELDTWFEFQQVQEVNGPVDFDGESIIARYRPKDQTLPVVLKLYSLNSEQQFELVHEIESPEGLDFESQFAEDVKIRGNKIIAMSSDINLDDPVQRIFHFFKIEEEVTLVDEMFMDSGNSVYFDFRDENSFIHAMHWGSPNGSLNVGFYIGFFDLSEDEITPMFQEEFILVGTTMEIDQPEEGNPGLWSYNFDGSTLVVGMPADDTYGENAGKVIIFECPVEGCTNPEAENYNGYANISDESCVGCDGDFNGDGNIDAPDLLQFLAEFQNCENEECIADLDGNGDVNADDFLLFLTVFGTGCND